IDYFLKEHHRALYPRIWEASTHHAAQSQNGKVDENEVSAGDQELWKQLVAACHHFDATQNRYALIVDAVPNSWLPSALGPGAWSAVIDLDPHSDSEGLYSHVGPTFEQVRGVHI